MYSDWRHPAKDNEVTMILKDSLHLIRDTAEIEIILYNPFKYEKVAGECDGDSTLNHPIVICSLCPTFHSLL